MSLWRSLINSLAWLWSGRLPVPLSRASSSRVYLYPDGRGVPVRQTRLAPEGLEFYADVAPARWVEETLVEFGKVSSMLPAGFPAYARVFHPAYMGDGSEPVRWSTVAAWNGKAVHPLMQFEFIANLGSDPDYPDPPWGQHPKVGSIPEPECRALAGVLREFTSTPEACWFCLWEGFGNLDESLYRRASRVQAPGRSYLLFHGPMDAVMSFITGRDPPFWRDSPNIWWPQDRSWCVATDIDLVDTYVAGSVECIEALLVCPDLEAQPTTRDAPLGMDKDTINAP